MYSLVCSTCTCQCDSDVQFDLHLKDAHLVAESALKGCTEPISLPDSRSCCVTCGRSFFSGDALTRHCDLHIKFPAQCATCRRIKCRKNSHARRPVTCELCPESELFLYPAALKAHIRQFHGILEKIIPLKEVCPVTQSKKKLPFFKCPHCPLKYVTVGVRQKHIQNAHKGKYHKCAVCMKAFTNHSNLLSHLDTFHGDEVSPGGKSPRSNVLHKCDHCSKVLSSKFSLSNHIEQHHLKISKYSCPVCAKPFRQRSGMKLHLETKHKSSNYLACEVCSRVFKLRSHLTRHEQSVHGKNFVEDEKTEVESSPESKESPLRATRNKNPKYLEPKIEDLNLHLPDSSTSSSPKVKKPTTPTVAVVTTPKKLSKIENDSSDKPVRRASARLSSKKVIPIEINVSEDELML